MNTPTSLVALSEEYAHVEQAMLRAAEENLGEIPPDVALYLDTIESQIAYKADHYKFVLDRLEESGAMLYRQAEEFERAAKALSRAREAMKERILTSMQAMETTEVRGVNFRFKLQKNATPSLEFPPTWDKEPPPEFTSLKPYLDTTKLRAEVEAGKPIPGVKLTQGYHIRSYINKGD